LKHLEHGVGVVLVEGQRLTDQQVVVPHLAQHGQHEEPVLDHVPKRKENQKENQNQKHGEKFRQQRNRLNWENLNRNLVAFQLMILNVSTAFVSQNYQKIKDEG
jgi:hypothetical protein